MVAEGGASLRKKNWMDVARSLENARKTSAPHARAVHGEALDYEEEYLRINAKTPSSSVSTDATTSPNSKYIISMQQIYASHLRSSRDLCM
jgi:hypothetical protein